MIQAAVVDQLLQVFWNTCGLATIQQQSTRIKAVSLSEPTGWQVNYHRQLVPHRAVIMSLISQKLLTWALCSYT